MITLHFAYIVYVLQMQTLKNGIFQSLLYIMQALFNLPVITEIFITEVHYNLATKHKNHK